MEPVQEAEEDPEEVYYFILREDDHIMAVDSDGNKRTPSLSPPRAADAQPVALAPDTPAAAGKDQEDPGDDSDGDDSDNTEDDGECQNNDDIDGNNNNDNDNNNVSNADGNLDVGAPRAREHCCVCTSEYEATYFLLKL